LPKVSVVLPIYNSSKYLCDALDSVTCQTLKDIEIICVNDGSKDDSLIIVKEYAAKDERIIIIDKPNSGYGHTMNVGIDAATGEYLGILETDDFIALTMFEDLYTAAVQNDLDTIRGDYFYFTGDKGNNMELKYMAIDRGTGLYNKIFNTSDDVKYARARVNTWAGIYRLSFLRKNNIRHHETPGASFQDNGFYWQVQINAKRAMLVNQPYYYCRRDNPNSSVKDTTKIWAMSREYDFIRDILMKDEDIWHKFKGYYWLLKFWNYNFTFNLITLEKKRDFIMRISKEFIRAMDLGEISPELFGVLDWQKIQFIMNAPDGYFQIFSQKQGA